LVSFPDGSPAAHPAQASQQVSRVSDYHKKLAILQVGCTPYTPEDGKPTNEVAYASYGMVKEFLANPTANGEAFQSARALAAHKTRRSLPNSRGDRSGYRAHILISGHDPRTFSPMIGLDQICPMGRKAVGN